MANKNGFESAMAQLKTVAKINEKVALGTLEEAAEYFVSVLKPQLKKSNVSKEHMVDALQVKIEKGKVIAVINKGDTQVAAMADYIIEIPETSECFSPILASVPLQLLSYYIAVERGANVDQPRNLAKSVTVE